MSTMFNAIRERSKWLATDMHTGSKLTELPCANKQLEEVLYLWFITNGPAGKGGDILGEELREMATELAKDPRFEVKSNFKFSNGWLEGFKKRYNIKQYTRFGEAASAVEIRNLVSKYSTYFLKYLPAALIHLLYSHKVNSFYQFLLY